MTPFNNYLKRLKNVKHNAILGLVRMEFINITLYMIICLILMRFFNVALTKTGFIIGFLVLVPVVALTNMSRFKRSMMIVKYCNMYLKSIMMVIKSSQMLEDLIKDDMNDKHFALWMIDAILGHLETVMDMHHFGIEIETLLKEMDLADLYYDLNERAESETEKCLDLIDRYRTVAGLAIPIAN